MESTEEEHAAGQTQHGSTHEGHGEDVPAARAHPAEAPSLKPFLAPADLLRLTTVRPPAAIPTRSVEASHKPMTALDREQTEALVSPSSALYAEMPTYRVADGSLACDSCLSQGPYQLRCPPAELPLDRLRHLSARQEEPEHPHTMRRVPSPRDLNPHFPQLQLTPAQVSSRRRYGTPRRPRSPVS